MGIKSSLEKIIDASGENPKFRCASADRGIIKLVEENEMEIELVDFPNNHAVSVKLPQNQEGFLKEGRLTKICDYLIIIPQGDRNMDIVFCELKKTLNDDKENKESKVKKASQQIKSTMPLFRYIESAVETHCNLRQGIKIRKIKRLIIFEQMANLSKGITRGTSLQKYWQEEDNMKFCVIANAKKIPMKEIDIDDNTPELYPKDRN